MIVRLSKRIFHHLQIVKPETLLKNQWTHKHKPTGRPPIAKAIRDLILEMKRDNPLWGCIRISDELKKVGIDVHFTTGNKIIQTFRKNTQIVSTGTRKKFLKSHWESLRTMDFATNGFQVLSPGNILKEPVLFGLHHHYFRSSA